jgi:hypothetical protein
MSKAETMVKYVNQFFSYYSNMLNDIRTFVEEYDKNRSHAIETVCAYFNP